MGCRGWVFESPHSDQQKVTVCTSDLLLQLNWVETTILNAVSRKPSIAMVQFIFRFGVITILTPMMVQYLVGLCCLRHDPTAVEIIVGDMVYDKAAEKKRDVDITITFKNEDGSVSAFKAAEVKKESKPLDVATIEQLCIKFSDMPQITHKAIFSTSGYSEAAKAKAKYHLVDIYTLKPWNKRIEYDFPDFNGVSIPSEFLAIVDACILRWLEHSSYIVVPNGPSAFHWNDDTPLFLPDGSPHDKYSDMGKYIGILERRSADILCTINPILNVAKKLIHPSEKTDREPFSALVFNHSHTMGINTDDAYLKLEDTLCKITSITLSGILQWDIKRREPEFYILENALTQEIFAGAAIADYGENDGRMFAMIFPESGREIGIHPFFIPEKQKNIIHNLKLKG